MKKRLTNLELAEIIAKDLKVGVNDVYKSLKKIRVDTELIDDNARELTIEKFKMAYEVLRR